MSGVKTLKKALVTRLRVWVITTAIYLKTSRCHPTWLRNIITFHASIPTEGHLAVYNTGKMVHPRILK